MQTVAIKKKADEPMTTKAFAEGVASTTAPR